VALGAALLAAGACTDASDVTLLEIDATGTVAGIVFLDADGDGQRTGADVPQGDIRVVLLGSSGNEVQDATTDTLGLFIFEDVPAGAYTVRIPAGALGDSLLAAPEAGEEVQLQREDTVVVELGVSYPVVDVEAVDTLPRGSRIFTSGIALNSRLPFGDGRVHIRGASGALRAIRVDRASLATGDSVRLLGRTAIDQGRTVLDEVSAVVLVNQAALPVPEEVSTADAATADAGALDADLVRVRNAAILDTATVQGDLRVTIDDGSGPLEMVLQSFLQVDPRAFQPDTVVEVARAAGLLVPLDGGDGTVSWRLFPRGGGDLALQLRSTDVAIAKTSDFDVASRNDTVTFSLVLENRGARQATDVQVVDSLPLGLTFLDASTTRGTFESGEGRWSVGDLPEGAVDTLEVRVRVTTAVPGRYVSRARILPLSREADTNLSNNVAAAAVDVVPREALLADLQVTLDADVSDAVPGDTVALTVTALNAGPLPVTAVEIGTELTDGLDVLDATTSTGAYDPAAGLWSLDRIPVAGSETLFLSAQVAQDTSGVLEVQALSRGSQRETDPDPTNDTASVSLEVSALQSADIEVSMSAADSTVESGDTVAITLVARNAGPSDAEGVQLSDTLPTGLAFLDATATTGSYDTGTALWDIGDLAASTADTLVVRAEVVATAPDTLVNRARFLGLARPGFDPDEANDTASIALVVVEDGEADLSLALWPATIAPADACPRGPSTPLGTSHGREGCAAAPGFVAGGHSGTSLHRGLPRHPGDAMSPARAARPGAPREKRRRRSS
jgi:uncharacterized repeat protein (TIGR01451 family)